MDKLSERLNDAVNRLIGACRDGEYGFRTCAQHVRSKELRLLFARHSDDCHDALEELLQAQMESGGTVEEFSCAAGLPLRQWAALRGKVTFDSDEQILAEAVRGGEITVSRYTEILSASLPTRLRELIERQLAAARRNRDEVVRLAGQAALSNREEALHAVGQAALTLTPA